VPGSVLWWFTHPKTVTHPGTSLAWHRVTVLIETNVLLLSQTSYQQRAVEVRDWQSAVNHKQLTALSVVGETLQDIRAASAVQDGSVCRVGVESG